MKRLADYIIIFVMSFCLFADGYYTACNSKTDLIEIDNDGQEENDGKEERDNLNEKEFFDKVLYFTEIPFVSFELKKRLAFNNNLELIHQIHKSLLELPPELI